MVYNNFPCFGEIAESASPKLYNSYKELVAVNRIRELRLSREMKQSDLALLLKCAPTAVSKYELGQLDVGSATICKLCEIFGCTADYLLGRSVLPTSDISAEEARLLQAYRRCDDRARDMVQLALAPFAQEDGSIETA